MRSTLVTATVLVAALLTGLPAQAKAGPAATGTEPAATTGTEPAAQDAAAEPEEVLAEAEELFDGTTDAAAHTAEEGREATLVLRDLALVGDALTGAQRRQARSLLARPTDKQADPVRNGYRRSTEPRSTCSEHLCYHWVETTADAPDLTDADADDVPDWVEGPVAGTFETVWQRVVTDLGYRAPVADDRGGDGTARNRPKLDVYLADIADIAYGYCTSDKVGPTGPSPAYCVVDNDFAEFSGQPLQDLQVTAAHEFFHTVQYAYDAAEDTWLMEGTATWIEDVVFDEIDDNLQFLASSPLTYPGVPLDFAGNDLNSFGFRYGNWVFWQYLTEQVGDPGLVREVWQRAAADRVYSLRAVDQALRARGHEFAGLFADFGAANRQARQTYTDGDRYPEAGELRVFTLGRSRPASGWHTARLDHLSNAHVRFRPALDGRVQRRLRVDLDLPGRVRSPRATVAVQRRDGSTKRLPVALGRSGAARVSVPFDRRTVRAVVVTLTNASIRMRCDRGLPFACAGASRDDWKRFRYSARARR